LVLLFPVDWPEPFGLVMIEAMACGTPIIAFRRGAVAEVVQEGTSGVIVDSVEQAVVAVARAASLDRAAVRTEFEARFTAERMANDYLRLYRAQAEPELPAVGGLDSAQQELWPIATAIAA
jgi:glycosyltransferase involved in cell wall biosynthesis